MTFKLSASEVARLQAARALCPLGEDPTSDGNWVPFYQELSRILDPYIRLGTFYFEVNKYFGLGIPPKVIVGNDLQNLRNAQLWLDVAVGANGGTGVHSAFIRDYTNREGVLRLGAPFDERKMQLASNGVAVKLWNNLKNNLWTIPRIDQIASEDAASIGENLYADLLGPLDTAARENSAWSGTLGFNLLGGANPFESSELGVRSCLLPPPALASAHVPPPAP